MSAPIQNLGNALRAARLKKHYSQEQLAERLDITVTHLQHIESGFRKPSIELYFALVQALDFSTDSFLTEQADDSLAHQRSSVALMASQCTRQQLTVLLATAQALLDSFPAPEPDAGFSPESTPGHSGTA